MKKMFNLFKSPVTWGGYAIITGIITAISFIAAGIVCMITYWRQIESFFAKTFGKLEEKFRRDNQS